MAANDWHASSAVYPAHLQAQMHMSTVFEVSEDLRSAGLAATPMQRTVLGSLHKTQKRHFTADDVFRQAAVDNLDVSLGSIYRMLKQFEQVGLLRGEMLHPTKVVYELNNGPKHDHVICVACGKIEEFHDPLLAASQRAACERLGFAFAGRSLVIHGHCARCSTGRVL
jgi:Fur family ferric uptake transcriptional regulator